MNGRALAPPAIDCRIDIGCNDGYYFDYVCQWLDSFELGAALVLGENIGTTITANLAALTANTQARRGLQSDLVRSQLVRLATGSSSSRARVQEYIAK